MEVLYPTSFSRSHFIYSISLNLESWPRGVDCLNKIIKIKCIFEGAREVFFQKICKRRVHYLN